MIIIHYRRSVRSVEPYTAFGFWADFIYPICLCGSQGFFHCLSTYDRVLLGVEHIKQAMAKYAAKYALDQIVDKVCLVITDIRHQGRAKSFQIIEALDTDGDQQAAYTNLLQLGRPWYESRIRTLKKAINALLAEQRLGIMKYDVGAADFVPL